MSRALLLETSSANYSGGVVVDGDLVVVGGTNRQAPDFDGVPGLARFLLATPGLTFADLTAIVVDVGPGKQLLADPGDRVDPELVLGAQPVAQLSLVADAPFTTDNGEMTPSLKVRRHVVRARYGTRLDALYRG